MTNSADPDQKPTDLDLHCLQMQGISVLRTRVNIFGQKKTTSYLELYNNLPLSRAISADNKLMINFIFSLENRF